MNKVDEFINKDIYHLYIKISKESTGFYDYPINYYIYYLTLINLKNTHKYHAPNSYFSNDSRKYDKFYFSMRETIIKLIK
jgi:hypothetical protein